MSPTESPQEGSEDGNTRPENERPKLATEFSGADLVAEFLATLSNSPATREIYGRTLYQLTGWIAHQPGSQEAFTPEALTRTSIAHYLSHLAQEGRSLSHQTRVRVVTGRFARWLVEEKALLRKNPVSDITLPPQQVLAPRELTPDQRYALQNVVEREGSARSAALFALGYWTGCRVSDVAHLTVENTHVGPKIGWIRTGYKGGKMRDIDLVNERAALCMPTWKAVSGGNEGNGVVRVLLSLPTTGESPDRKRHPPLVRHSQETSPQRGMGTAAGHHLPCLRHDFAHRARAAGWNLEEIAYYLGHVTAQGLPAIQTTVRYTQVSREQVKNKLRLLHI